MAKNGDGTVTLYSATPGGMEPGRRFLDKKRAENYLHDANLYYLCDGKKGVEYYLDAEDIEIALDYEEMLYDRWQPGYEPGIYPTTVPESHFLQMTIDDELFNIVVVRGYALVSRDSDGLYFDCFEAPTPQDVTEAAVAKIVHETIFDA
ncbi:MAG: hypothetical protein IKN64_00040 [Desulfovibrio sp.]|nr:hypothetical protein [Desulfovibrio sp.]